jgi:hypothetical protein
MISEGHMIAGVYSMTMLVQSAKKKKNSHYCTQIVTVNSPFFLPGRPVKSYFLFLFLNFKLVNDLSFTHYTIMPANFHLWLDSSLLAVLSLL